MLVKLFDHPEKSIPEILARLDRLRRLRTPIEVDLFRDPPFPGSIDPHEFDLISMQFVADSITENEHDYLRCFGRVTDMVRPGGALTMSAIVDSDGWQLGSIHQPSPNISEKTMLNFLASQGLKIINLSRSIRSADLTYTGGWIVLAAVRG